ncbi:MAG: tetratricopeptide repeat protein [Polyangiales bacterium]
MDHPADTIASVTADRLFDFGLHYAGQGDLQRAEQYLSAARQRGYDERVAVFWLLRICVFAGRYHAALEHADTYLKKQPDDWALRLVIASIHEALGDFSRARAVLESIVQSEPDRALPHYRLALLYSAQHSEPAMVRRHLQEYLRLAPDGTHGAEVVATLRELQNLEADRSSVSLLGQEHPVAEEAP